MNDQERPTKIPPGARVLAQGRYLALVDEGGWEYAIRPHVAGIVVIVAVTDDAQVVLVEQYRRAVHNRVVELPARRRDASRPTPTTLRG